MKGLTAMYTRIDGKEVSASVRENITETVAALKAKGTTPGLAVIIVGNDPASRVYVNNKKKGCEQTGMNSYEYAMPEDTTTQELIELIEKLNKDDNVDGILCQLPVPKQIDEEKVLNAISPEKDVDAFHPVNCGKVMTGDYTFAPCTPAGMVEMLQYYNIPITGKHCVIIGRSNIVGKPMAMLMLKNNATVTVCHSKTADLSAITKQADILVAAVGIPKFVKADMVKEGAVVLDVGINRMENGKLCGDVDFDEVAEKTSFITPVPGGVGPMTITMLLKNTLASAQKRADKNALI